MFTAGRLLSRPMLKLQKLLLNCTVLRNVMASLLLFVRYTKQVPNAIGVVAPPPPPPRAQCSHVMNILRYELEYTDQLPKFSEEEIAEFRRLNEEGKAAKKASLQETDPEDHNMACYKRRFLKRMSSSLRSVRPNHSGMKSRISYVLSALFSFGFFWLVLQVAS